MRLPVKSLGMVALAFAISACDITELGGMPNLSVEGHVPDRIHRLGDDVPVTLTIRNTGDGSSPQTVALVYGSHWQMLDPTSSAYAGSYGEREVNIPEIRPQSSYEVTVLLPLREPHPYTSCGNSAGPNLVIGAWVNPRREFEEKRRVGNHWYLIGLTCGPQL